MSSDTQLAYLAGLIDGEGTIALFLNTTKTVQLRLHVYSSTEVVMDWLQLYFGGYKNKVGRPARPNHAQEWSWNVGGNRASEILVSVLPYLVIKQAKARIAVEAWQNRTPTPLLYRREPIPEAVLALRNTYITQFRDAPGISRNKN